MDFIFSSKIKVTHTHVNGLKLFLCVDYTEIFLHQIYLAQR